MSVVSYCVWRKIGACCQARTYVHTDMILNSCPSEKRSRAHSRKKWHLSPMAPITILSLSVVAPSSSLALALALAIAIALARALATIAALATATTDVTVPRLVAKFAAFEAPLATTVAISLATVTNCLLPVFALCLPLADTLAAPRTAIFTIQA